MQNRMIWFERKFKFDFPTDIYPMIVERLRGTPVRLETKLASVSPELLTRQPDDGWSLQQQAGHLVDIEPLWLGRLDDFINGKERLRPADIKNRKTHDANHNEVSIESILTEFRQLRTELVDRLYVLTIKQAGLTALHPRLDQPMRLIDAYYFAAEHDDHHLSRMTDLLLTA